MRKFTRMKISHPFFLIILLSICFSCIHKHSTDKFDLGEIEFDKITKEGTKYLNSKDIDFNNVKEIDTLKYVWVKRATLNQTKLDTINSFSSEWGYLEAFDDIKHNKLAIIPMGMGWMSPTSYEPLLSKCSIRIKLWTSSLCFSDSGAIAYDDVMYAYIQKKYGIDFFDKIKQLSDSVDKLSEDARTKFIKNFKPYSRYE
jgi:hypothetical protein